MQQETANSAALGGCYRALHVCLGGEDSLSYSEALAQRDGNIDDSAGIEDTKRSSFVLKATPNLDADKVYSRLSALILFNRAK